MVEVCHAGGRIGEFGTEDKGELGRELRGEDMSDTSSGDNMVGGGGEEIKRVTVLSHCLVVYAGRKDPLQRSSSC